MKETDQNVNGGKSPDPDAKNIHLKRTVLVTGVDEMNNFRLGANDKNVTSQRGN